MKRQAMRVLGVAFVAGAALLAGAAEAQQPAHPKYDYPTAARADYVIGCLAANGMNRALLDKCACAIDTIANILPYKDYEKAATILSMRQGGLGMRGTLFRNTTVAQDEMRKLRAAQAQATLHCQ